MQNDFSLVDRRSEENGVSEASSPVSLSPLFTRQVYVSSNSGCVA